MTTKCPCDFCNILNKEPELRILESDEFKKRALALPDLSQEIRNGIASSDMTFLNIILGIVPEGMTLTMFIKILNNEHFRFHGISAQPLLPIVQESWDGVDVADWLINSRMVPGHMSSIIHEKLDGKTFLQGRVQGVLSYDNVMSVNALVQQKAFTLSEYVGRIGSQPPARHFIATCRLLGIDPQNASSRKEIEKQLYEKYSLSFRLPLPMNPDAEVDNILVY